MIQSPNGVAVCQASVFNINANVSRHKERLHNGSLVWGGSGQSHGLLHNTMHYILLKPYCFPAPLILVSAHAVRQIEASNDRWAEMHHSHGVDLNR